jgi:Ca-activated chloride channel homolog
MKKIFLLALFCGFALRIPATETLKLKIEPDHDQLLKGSAQEVVLKIDLAAGHGVSKHKRTPLNIAVVLDRSGSMAGAKIEKARQAAMAVVDQLSNGDTFSLVTYSAGVEVLVPAQPVEDRESLKSRISRIRTDGGTALYAGVEAGAVQLRRYLSDRKINRVILLSDGLANVGPSSPADLRRLGERLSRDGIPVTTVGVGDDYNEDLMSGLAEASDANYYYVKDTETLPKIFAKELGQLLRVAAREVRIEIICPDHVKPMGFLGRPEKFENGRAIVYLNQFAAGQTRSLLLHCNVNGRDDAADLATVKVRYVDELQDGAERAEAQTARVRFTADAKAAAASARTEVVAQRELLLTAVAKDQALAQADSGQYDKAASTLANQAVNLEISCQTAPPELQKQMKQEAQNLRNYSNELRQRNYTSGSRKDLQYQSYNVRNQKQ